MKQIVGVDVGSYTFNAVTKEITIAGLNPLALEHILLVTNTTRNKVYYAFNSGPSATITGNFITLTADTTGHANGDRLQIIIDYESQAALLPTGAATSAAQATGNASLASIDGKLTSPIAVTGSVSTGLSQPLTDTELRATPVPVSASSLPLPTGAATEAKQDTIIGHVDGIEALLSTIDADTGSIASDASAIAADVASLEAKDFATETTLSTAAASLSVIDDWDESDRAKVNPIVGSAGVQGGSGTVSANTQRTVLATDVALPAGTNLIGRIQDDAQTGNGVTPYSALSGASVLTAEIKGSAGNIYSLSGFNTHTLPIHVRLYNQTGAPADTDTANIIWRGTIPNNGADGAGFVVEFDKAITCGTGIGIRATLAAADNDNTALVANTVKINVGYK